MQIILGTRPQIIKSAPVYAAFKRHGVECDVINTGQHFDYEMNKRFFSELELPEPAAELNVGAGSPTSQVASIISGLGRVFENSRPDLAISPGDTNSALAAGIACSKSRVPVAHLESGYRSGDVHMPEEINRRLLDHMCQVLLCPTEECLNNVRAEHVKAEVVANVGDTMYDSFLKFKPSVEAMDVPRKRGFEAGNYAFMTLHRGETVDDAIALERVLEAVGDLGIDVAFSVHPRTRERIKTFNIKLGARVKLLEPLPYLEALSMVAGSKFVITDSGGLQKESYWLGRPVLLVRDRAEWMETVKAGAAFLVGTDPEKFREGYLRVQGVGKEPFLKSSSFFGSGNASDEVVKVVTEYLTMRGRSPA